MCFKCIVLLNFHTWAVDYFEFKSWYVLPLTSCVNLNMSLHLLDHQFLQTVRQIH